MACCMMGLLLVYQLIDAWQRARRMVGGWRVRLLGVADLAARPRGLAVVALIAFQTGYVGSWLALHADHLGALAHGIGLETGRLCRSVLTLAGV